MVEHVLAANPARDVLEELRRIMRMVHLQSRRLSASFGVTGPELVCLKELDASEALSQKELGIRIGVSPSTVTRLVDRLEAKDLAARRRDPTDRRRQLVELTAGGGALVRRAPLLLQDRLRRSLEGISAEEQASILRSLRRLTEMVNARDVDASPILAPGDLT